MMLNQASRFLWLYSTTNKPKTATKPMTLQHINRAMSPLVTLIKNLPIGFSSVSIRTSCKTMHQYMSTADIKPILSHKNPYMTFLIMR